MFCTDQTHGDVVLLVQPAQQLDRILRQAREAGRVLADVGEAVVLFHVQRNRQAGLNLVDAVFLVRITQEAR